MLLNEDQAAAQLQLHPRTLRKERQEGRLSYIMVGRRILYAPQDLADFVDRMRRQEPTTPQPAGKPGRRVSANRRSGVIVPFSARDGARR